MKVILIKKGVLYSILCFMICFAIVGISVCLSVNAPKSVRTIVIDAGHGGIDGGASGKATGVSESYLNLIYAKILGKICEEFGFKVVQTRKDMEGLYSDDASIKKKSEMKKREEIIDKSNPDIVVSIHMNSFSTSNTKGAHVFYKSGNESGKALAESVAKTLSSKIVSAHENAKVGDYYILNCTDKPAVLVECGFLSNPEEEVLLQDEEYANKFCYYLFCGIL